MGAPNKVIPINETFYQQCCHTASLLVNENDHRDSKAASKSRVSKKLQDSLHQVGKHVYIKSIGVGYLKEVEKIHKLITHVGTQISRFA